MFIVLGLITSFGWTFGIVVLLSALVPEAAVSRGWFLNDLLETERRPMILTGATMLVMGTASFAAGNLLVGTWAWPWAVLW